MVSLERTSLDMFHNLSQGFFSEDLSLTKIFSESVWQAVNNAEFTILVLICFVWKTF